MSYACKVIAHSKAPHGGELFTVQVRFPRFILAQVNTYGSIAKNARSSRAVPTEKLIEEVEKDPVVPIRWGTRQKGMVAGEELSEWSRGVCWDWWKEAAECAVERAERLARLGASKETVNRLLEPFMWVDVVATATNRAWYHYFAQRCAHDAQPEHQHLARMIARAYRDSAPAMLGVGMWHVPYVSDEEIAGLEPEDWLAFSVTRVRRVSWKPFDGEPDLLTKAHIKHDESRDAGHWSCFEHQGQAAFSDSERSGRMRGFVEYRQMLPVSVHESFDFSTLDAEGDGRE